METVSICLYYSFPTDLVGLTNVNRYVYPTAKVADYDDLHDRHKACRAIEEDVLSR